MQINFKLSVNQARLNFGARTVRVNQLTKFKNLFTKAGRKANEQIERMTRSKAYRMDFFQRNLDNGMIALQFTKTDGDFYFMTGSRKNPFTKKIEELMLITKNGRKHSFKEHNVYSNKDFLVNSRRKYWDIDNHIDKTKKAFVERTELLERNGNNVVINDLLEVTPKDLLDECDRVQTIKSAQRSSFRKFLCGTDEWLRNATQKEEVLEDGAMLYTNKAKYLEFKERNRLH